MPSPSSVSTAGSSARVVVGAAVSTSVVETVGASVAGTDVSTTGADVCATLAGPSPLLSPPHAEVASAVPTSTNQTRARELMCQQCTTAVSDVSTRAISPYSRPVARGGLPRGRDDVLLRDRLLDVLDERWSRRLVLVVGGPGAGKTTLLVQALHSNVVAPRGLDVWAPCGPTDATSHRLVEQITDQLGVPPSDDAAALVAACSDAVWRRSPIDVSLVIDDVHHLVAGSVGAESLALLVEALPANGHAVLAGRADPAIPIARLVAQNEVARIEADELPFTADEGRQFAAMRGVSPNLVERVGGWPALALSMLAPQSRASSSGRRSSPISITARSPPLLFLLALGL